MSTTPFEQFVDADEAGRFLCLTRRRILELARAGKLPGHPIGDGPRRTWRFLLSELADSMGKKLVASGGTLRYGSTQAASSPE